NLALHGTRTSSLLAHAFECVQRFIDRLSRVHPIRLRYFVHSGAEQLLPRLFHARGIEVTPVTGPAANLLRHYRELDLHVCCMLHSAILATSCGVPTINLAYDIKNHAFFSLMDSPTLCVDAAAATPEQLLAMAEQALTDGPGISDRLLQRV